MKEFKKLPKLTKGDAVSIISPSADFAGRWPWVLELGLDRLESELGLIPKEYPHTRKLNANLKERADDIMQAFSDPGTKAVIATIGGQDQIKLLKYLDKKVLLQNPKPFFGFSDNTHLGNFLWNLGIPSYYGGCILTQYAFEQGMQNFTIEYLKHAFFDNGEFELKRSPEYNDITNDWATEKSLKTPRLMEENEQWYWSGSNNAEGILWGGCLESMVVQSSTQIYMPKDEDLDGTVLFLESADGNTRSWIAEYVLTGFGERGWFDKFQAVLIGRPKAWELDLQIKPTEKTKYRKEQRDMIFSVVRNYNKDIPIIQNLDFGHTDPQVVLPKGGKVKILSDSKKIFLNY
ncbi:LD-carboxypeptidase [Candidatus Saccharibacteria bacterium]|nr:LD-carboxypeptidase [Candidatus Saccharibacteria bacterium]